MKKEFWVFYSIIFLFISCKNNKGEMGKAYYEGEDLSNVATVIRNKDTKSATLVINYTGKWVVYGGLSVEDIDYSEPLAGGFEAGRYPLDINNTSRLYFQLVTEKGRAIFSERRLPMSGGYNFRDLGGFRNKDGKYVKWGKIFRSDDLYNLTDIDLDYLSSIPITSIVDFRSEEEIDKAPDRLPISVKNSYPLSINPGNLNVATDIYNLPPEKIDSLMMDIYEILVSDPLSVKQYREFFKLLQSSKNIPLMFHCSAGKDRTGMGAALVLFALNVDEKVILDDYLASNMYLGDKYKRLIEEKPNLKPLFEVKKEFLMSGIDHIRRSHGSIENYLKNVLLVDIDKFQKMYLY